MTTILNKRQLTIYIQELSYEIQLLFAAAKNYNNAINQLKENSNNDQTADIQLQLLLSINGIVGAAARISSLIYPKGLPKKDVKSSDRFRVARGEELQKIIGLGDSLLKDKSLRNYIEHFDEKIDKWARDPNIRSYVSKLFGNLDNIIGLERKDVMRQIDIENGVVTIPDETFDIQQIINAALELKAKIENVNI